MLDGVRFMDSTTECKVFFLFVDIFGGKENGKKLFGHRINFWGCGKQLAISIGLLVLFFKSSQQFKKNGNRTPHRGITEEQIMTRGWHGGGDAW